MELLQDEPINFLCNNYNATPITNSESFEYKTNVAGKTSNANEENGENTEQENAKIKE